MARAHGWSGYQGGCRCEVCTEANRERSADRRRRERREKAPARTKLGDETRVLLARVAKLEGVEPEAFVDGLTQAESIRILSLPPRPHLAPGAPLGREHFEWAAKRWPDLNTNERIEKMKSMSKMGASGATGA